MTLDEVINQLKDLREHCYSMADKDDPDCVWIKDLLALDIAIEMLGGETDEI